MRVDSVSAVLSSLLNLWRVESPQFPAGIKSHLATARLTTGQDESLLPQSFVAKVTHHIA